MNLKRYAMPRYWRLERKTSTWITVPRGPHSREISMPLRVVIRDMLKLAETGKEATRVIAEGKIMVDKKVRKDPKFGVGLMDVVEIPEMKKAFRLMVTRNGLKLEEVKPAQAGLKLCRIDGKRTLRGGATQLSLHDGRSIKMDSAKTYKPNDSVLISLPDQKIVKHFRLEKGSPAFIIAGKNAGDTGKIREIRKRKDMLGKSTVTVQSKNREIFTPLEYVMVGEIA